MNLSIATAAATSLPAILDESFSSSGSAPAIRRRRQIQDLNFTPADLDRFNRLLADLGRRSAPLDRDQLATAGRQLSHHGVTAPPACIALRMSRLATVLDMVADPGWTPSIEAYAVARRVLDYVKSHGTTSPDQIREQARLDDAIVIETAWPAIAEEIDLYLDFLQLRRFEADLWHCEATKFAFTRQDWENDRAIAAALKAHQQRVRENSYLPPRSGLFRIH